MLVLARYLERGNVDPGAEVWGHTPCRPIFANYFVRLTLANIEAIVQAEK